MIRAKTVLIAVAFLACVNRRHEEAKSIMATKAPSNGMTITSPAFADQGEIPKKYGCSGQSISPPLSIAGVPSGARNLSLIVTDPDAPGGLFTHWIVWNIPATAGSIGEGQPPGGTQGQNSYGKTGYGPPCPPSGSHRYIFDVYALDTALNVAPGAGREELEKAMSGHVLAQARLVGTYRK